MSDVRYVDVWTLTVRGDDISTTIHPTEKEALAELRRAWAFTPASRLPDDKVIDHVEQECGIEVRIVQHGFRLDDWLTEQRPVTVEG